MQFCSQQQHDNSKNVCHEPLLSDCEYLRANPMGTKKKAANIWPFWIWPNKPGQSTTCQSKENVFMWDKFPAGYLKRPSCLLGRVAIQNTCGIRFIQEPNWFTSPACRFRQSSFERFRLNHVYGKRQTSVSSWEFLKIGNEQIETVQNGSLMDKNGVKLLIFE